MMSMKKQAVAKQVGGFMQTRKGRRPIHPDKLILKNQEKKPSEVFHKWDGAEKPAEDSKASDSFVLGVATERTDEFNKEALEKKKKLVKRSMPKWDPNWSLRGAPEFELESPEMMKEGKAELKTELLPHQKRVVKRMGEQEGLVVAHGLGSGKTLSSIGAIVDLGPTKARVIVPAALKENYKKEIKKHVKGGLPVQVESLQKVIRDGSPPRGDMLVVDEAHRVRNPGTKGYQMLRDAPVKKRMLMTASPVYNAPGDIAPLVNIAAGRKELPVGTEFDRAYVQKADKGFLALINPWAQKEPKIIRKERLSKVLNKWVDYHGSSDKGFPSLTERRVDVPMNDEQAALHAHAWGQLPWMTRMRIERGLPPAKKDLPKLNLFQSQVRQISSSQKKYSKGPVESTPKIQTAVQNFVEKSEKNPQHKAVVYANFLGSLDDYAGELERRKVPYSMFRGDMSKKVRDQSVRDLNEGRVKALLVSGAGGEGLDLKGVRQVQVLEPHWNEEKLRQVIGRARRYGSHAHLPEKQRNVDVERYAAYPKNWYGGKGRGIEESLYEISENKQRLNDQVLELLKKEGGRRPPKDSPYRERVEVFATRDGKVLGGRYGDESFGTYGGGIDPGESPYRAARREFGEEAGYRLRNLRYAREPQFASPWTEGEGTTLRSDQKAKWETRRAQYPSGHRTTYLVGRLGRQTPTSDTGTQFKDVRLYNINEAMRLQRRALRGTTGDDERRMRSRLAVLKELKEMEKGAERRRPLEFAPGIPIDRRIKPIPTVREKDPNEDWNVSVSMHPAAIRGDHVDLRLVDPKGRAHSWALTQAEMPAPGKSSYAVQQATHSGRYALRTKPFKIPPGYGATRPGTMVQPLDVGQTEVVYADPERVRFLTHRGQRTNEYVLRRVKGRADDGKPMWALNNATKNVHTIAGRKLPLGKPKYRNQSVGDIDVTDDQQMVQAKIDGAHALVHLEGPDRPTRVYSYRPAKRDTGLIEHTFKFPEYHKRKSPKELKGTVLRAELWASKGKQAVPPERVGALLNSGVPRSRQMQQESGERLRISAFDVVKHRGRDVSSKPYSEKLKILREAAKKTEGIELPPMAFTPRQKKRLIKRIQEGSLPHTAEGTVQWDLHRAGAAPVKAKIRPDQDVYVKGVFTKERGEARGHAGGFTYATRPDGPIVGRVGTGFDHATRSAMRRDPDKFIGRVAKVESQGPHRSGALRAPSFKQWHIDKTDPELMGDEE